MKNRHGWIRLGIVVSALWLVASAAYVAFDYVSHSVEMESRTVTPKDRAEGWEPVVFSTTFTACNFAGTVSCSPNWATIAVVVLLPLVSLWIIAVVTVVAFQWVRAGFKGET